jgi:hypothetical protein
MTKKSNLYIYIYFYLISFCLYLMNAPSALRPQQPPHSSTHSNGHDPTCPPALQHPAPQNHNRSPTSLIPPKTTKKERKKEGGKKSKHISFSVFVQCTQCNRPAPLPVDSLPM